MKIPVCARALYYLLTVVWIVFHRPSYISVIVTLGVSTGTCESKSWRTWEQGHGYLPSVLCLFLETFAEFFFLCTKIWGFLFNNTFVTSLSPNTRKISVNRDKMSCLKPHDLETWNQDYRSFSKAVYCVTPTHNPWIGGNYKSLQLFFPFGLKLNRLYWFKC